MVNIIIFIIKKGTSSSVFQTYFLLQGTLKKVIYCTLIISSPDGEFITYLYDRLHQQWNATEVKVGCMRFRIDSFDKLIVKLPVNSAFSLITGTPIIVRIPREKYEDVRN